MEKPYVVYLKLNGFSNWLRYSVDATNAIQALSIALSKYDISDDSTEAIEVKEQ